MQSEDDGHPFDDLRAKYYIAWDNEWLYMGAEVQDSSVGGSELWERFDEEHVERAYDNKTIRRLIREAGFVIKGYYRCFSFERPKKDSYRICVVAKKAG